MMANLEKVVAVTSATPLEDKYDILENLLVDWKQSSLDSVDPILLREFSDSLLTFIQSPQIRLSNLAITIASKLFQSFHEHKTKIVLSLQFGQELVEKFNDSKEKTRDLAITAMVDLVILVHDDQLFKPLEDLLQKSLLSKSPKTIESVTVTN